MKLDQFILLHGFFPPEQEIKTICKTLENSAWHVIINVRYYQF